MDVLFFTLLAVAVVYTAAKALAAIWDARKRAKIKEKFDQIIENFKGGSSG